MMKKGFFYAIVTVVGITILVAIITTLIIPYFLERPPRAVWVSDDSHIVIFQHRRYSSPFDLSTRDGFRQGYKVDDNGGKTYFLVSFFDSTMRFYDAQTFFDAGAQHKPIMYGYWRHARGRLTLDVDGEVIIFARATNYEPPNTFAWNPGLETLHGIWETMDGNLRLDLEAVSLLRTTSIIYGVSSIPRFQGVYNPGDANIGLLISGSFTAHTGQFSIVISENGNLRGHSFAPIGGGRFMRAEGTLDGDTIHLQINHLNPASMSGDWHFPSELILNRIS